MFRMETVSLHDDASIVSSAPASSTTLDVSSLEAQVTLMPESDAPVSHRNNVADEEETTHTSDRRMLSPVASVTKDQTIQEGHERVVVEVETGSKSVTNGPASQRKKQQHVLPPLRVWTHTLPVDERDYVDTTLFCPEVSRHAMEVAHRRATAIATEVKEMIELDGGVRSAANAKMTPTEAVSIIGNAFASSLKRAQKLMKPGTKEYDLVSGTSPSSTTPKLDELDTDGDGLQLSPDATYNNDGKHFCTPHLKPALKRISAYSSAAVLASEETLSTRPPTKKRILWHEEVLDADEEFYEDDSDRQETRALMNADQDAATLGNGSLRPQLLNYSSKSNRQLTPRSRKKRKKLVRSLMRRLTPREKEELYRQRPDLMIVPNWAQKYREELAGDDSTRWNAWLLALIMILAVLLLVFILLILWQRIAAAK